MAEGVSSTTGLEKQAVTVALEGSRKDNRVGLDGRQVQYKGYTIINLGMATSKDKNLVQDRLQARQVKKQETLQSARMKVAQIQGISTESGLTQHAAPK